MLPVRGLIPTFAVVLWIQAQLGSGVITGILQDTSGKPLTGVRVALTELSATDKAAAPGTVLVSIATTDSRGVYRLENVPQGRYYLVAGRVDNPTYYPGTLDTRSAKVVSVSSTSAIGGMDFTLVQESQQGPQIGEVLRSSRVSNLPLVGANVMDLLQTLPGLRAAGPFSFTFENVEGQRTNFSLPDGTTLSNACSGCTFLVWNRGIGIPGTNQMGILFQVKSGGKDLEFTCKATNCDVFPPDGGPRVLHRDEIDIIPVTSRTRFVVTQ